MEYMVAPYSGFACACCGTILLRGEEYNVCPDCSAIFCKECCENGNFDGHNCEELDYE